MRAAIKASCLAWVLPFACTNESAESSADKTSEENSDPSSDPSSDASSNDDSGDGSSQELSSSADVSDESEKDASGSTEDSASSDEQDETSSQDLCDDQVHELDLAWQHDEAFAWPAPVLAAASAPASIWACGEGYVGRRSADKKWLQLPDDAADPCVDIAGASDGEAWVVSRGGRLRVVTITNATLQEKSMLQLKATAIHRLRVWGGRGWLAAGKDGVLSLQSRETGELTIDADQSVASEDARDAVPFVDGMLLADGHAGVKYIIDGKVVAAQTGNGFAHEVLVRGDEAMVLRGGWGVDHLQWHDGKLKPAGSLIPDGSTRRGIWNDQNLWLSSGRDLLRLHATANRPQWRGTLQRPAYPDVAGDWLIDLLSLEGKLWGVTASALVPLQHDEAAKPTPSVMSAQPLLSLDDEVDDKASRLLGNLTNLGDAPLQVWVDEAPQDFALELVPTSGQSPCADDRAVVMPGQSLRFDVTHSASDNKPREETLVFRTNDPKHPRFTIKVEVNRAHVKVGTAIDDFTLLGANTAPWRFSQHRGKVLLLKLYMRMCTSCMEDLKAIESSIIPRFANEPFEVWGINSEASGLNVDQMLYDSLTKLPTLHDFELGILRYFRQPAQLFPLQVVVDKAGSIAYAGPDLQAAEAAIASELAKN